MNMKNTEKYFFAVTTTLTLFMALMITLGCISQNTPIPPPAEELRCQDCNVLLITIDALRADHLGCYGYYRNTTPTIDYVAENALLFENTFSQAPCTRRSIQQLMTSSYVIKPGPLNNSETTLAELMKQSGYNTGAVIHNNNLGPASGLKRGFDHYKEYYTPDLFWNNSKRDEKNNAGEITNHAIDWIEENQENKFFLWIHYFDPHDPYHPPDEFDMYSKNYSGKQNGHIRGTEYWLRNNTVMPEEDLKRVLDLYDGEITYADYNIGRVLEKISQLGLKNKTVVIITADHGESFGEHGIWTHCVDVYSAETRIPLVFYVPDVAKRRIGKPAQLIDVPPTILSILGNKKADSFLGRDLTEYINPNDKSRGYSYTIWMSRDSVTTEKWRLINDKRNKVELYDIEIDPEETVDFSDENPDVVENLELIRKNIKSQVGDELNASEGYDEELVKKLREIGYLA